MNEGDEEADDRRRRSRSSTRPTPSTTRSSESPYALPLGEHDSAPAAELPRLDTIRRYGPIEGSLVLF